MCHRKKSTRVTRKYIENENTAYGNLCYLVKIMLPGSFCLYMLIIEKKKDLELHKLSLYSGKRRSKYPEDIN